MKIIVGLFAVGLGVYILGWYESWSVWEICAAGVGFMGEK